MTFSKMCRILADEIKKHGEDFAFINVYDKYAFEVGEKDVTHVRKIRDKITLKDLAICFEMKEGSLYEVYHITQQFTDLIKSINKECFEPLQQYHVYEDTKSAFLEKWQEFHPGEDYEKYMRTRSRQAFNRIMGLYNTHASELHDVLASMQRGRII